MSECSNCDGVSKMWRIIIFLFIHGYVLYRAILRYVIVKEQIFSQLYGLDWDKTVINYLLWSIVTSLFFTMLCIYCYMQKTGHLANDGLQLKRDSQRIISLIKDGDIVTVCPNTLTKVISFPTCWNMRLFGGAVHLLCAYTLLLPNPWIIGEQIKHQVEPPDYLWQTDLSFLFPPHPLASRLNKFTELHNELVLDNRVAAATLFSLQPPALGGLGQLPQTEKQLETANRLRWFPSDSLIRLVPEVGRETIPTQRSVSVELINFLVAGVIVCVGLPTVFWHLSALYACVTSFLIGITLLHLTVDYASTSLLIQYATCLSYVESPETMVASKSAQAYEQLLSSLMLIRSPVHLPAWLLVLLTGLAFLPYLVNIHLLYAFGLSCLGEFEVPNQNRHQNRYEGCQGNPNISIALSNQSGYSIHQSWDNSLNRPSVAEARRKMNRPVCGSCPTTTSFAWFRSNSSTILAVSGIGCLLLSTGLRMPVECDLMRVYWENGDPLCLTSMTLFIINFLTWLLVWISFTLRKPYIFSSANVDIQAKISNDNLITSFNNENAAYIRCNGDITLRDRLPNTTTNSVPVPIFLDGEGVLYSAVQMNNATNSLRLEQSGSPVAASGIDRNFRPTRMTLYRQVEDDNISVGRQTDETITRLSPSTIVDQSQFGRLFETNGTLKRSKNSQKTDLCTTFLPLNEINSLNAGEELLNYTTDSMLMSTIPGFPSSNTETTCQPDGIDNLNVTQTRSPELVSSSTVTATCNPVSINSIPKEIATNYARSSDRVTPSIECQYSTQVSELTPQSRFSPAQRVSFRTTSNTAYLLVPQTKTTTDSSDSGDSACKISENPDCLASIRSYRYNLASLESRQQFGGYLNDGEADCTNSPVSIPPAMSTLSGYLYDPSTRLAYPEPGDASHQWTGSHGLIVIPTAGGQSTFLTNAKSNQNELFEGKLSSQV